MSLARHSRCVIDFSRVNAVLPTARARLFAIPGVHAVGMGRKIIGGEFTSEPAIMVFVEHKQPIAQLVASHVIPAEIDGVTTDVYESPIPHLQGSPDPDDENYDVLVGGIQIAPGGIDADALDAEYTGIGTYGTLGCFIQVGDLTPWIYGVTNFHVVGDHAYAQHTNLAPGPSDSADTGHTFSTGSDATVTRGTQLIVSVVLADDTRHRAFYMAGDSDTASDVAGKLAATLTSLGNGITGHAFGPALSVTAAGGTVFWLGPYGPTAGDKNASTTITVVQTSVSPPAHTIALSGDGDEFGGAYVRVNAGGVEPTRGGFVIGAPTLAFDIASLINDFSITGVSAEATAWNTLQVKGAQSILCQYSSDTRVGQATNRCFDCVCSHCCNHRIGRVAFADLEVDAALILLDPGIKYQGYIEGIGRIVGVHDVTQDSVGIPLKLRGRSSPTANDGTLIAINTAGVITYISGVSTESGQQPAPWQALTRYYTNAFQVRGNPFSRSGDSGAAICTPPVGSDGNATTTVAGIVFGIAGNLSLGTPIQAILSSVSGRFAPLQATLVTWNAAQPTQTVQAAPSGNPFPPALARIAHRAVPANTPQSVRLVQAQSEIGATPGGQLYAPLIMRHLNEAQTLVNTNRKMATVWQRNGGLAIANGLVRTLEIPGQRIPSMINGTPLADCLQQIASALARYGSDALAADIKAHGPALIELAHLSYPELLTALGAPATVPA
jgi:hypothetical protein